MRNGRNGVRPSAAISMLDKSEGYRMLDRLTQKHFNLSADEFIAAWRSGKLHDENEYPEAVRLAMMIPHVA